LACHGTILLGFNFFQGVVESNPYSIVDTLMLIHSILLIDMCIRAFVRSPMWVKDIGDFDKRWFRFPKHRDSTTVIISVVSIKVVEPVETTLIDRWFQ